MGTPKLQIRGGDHPDFLDLPWGSTVRDWDVDRLVDMPIGIHRHAVVFVAYDEGIYAIKEMPAHLSRNEFDVLRRLEERTPAVAEVAGLVVRPWIDPGEEDAAAVITKYVEHSFPYRRLVSGPGFGNRRVQMLDALAGLLVELHLAGCFWGDVSLSNALYRYDAGAVEAIMIDAETSVLRPQLSKGQRMEDLSIMKENLAGEMADIAVMQGVELDAADLGLGEDVEGRYLGLWNELDQVLVIAPNEGYVVKQRIERLNDLGFFVDDILLEPDGGAVSLKINVGGRTFHSQRLREMTGIDASENQARVLLGDLQAYLGKSAGQTPSGKSVGIIRWLNGVFEPAIEAVAAVWHGDDHIQGVCDLLQHRYELATEAERDIPVSEALVSWEERGFPGFPIAE
jgi:hypothetical protein